MSDRYLSDLTSPAADVDDGEVSGSVILGDAAALIAELEVGSIALSVWSPPYHVGKSYEADHSFADWQELLRRVILGHARVLKPGGFCVINIADILCFPDPNMPRIQAETLSDRRLAVSREDVEAAIDLLGTFDRRKLGAHLGVSEQTIDRRLKGNNIRGGKYSPQTRVFPVAGMIEAFGLEAGLYLYDRRIWQKDPAWANSRWHTSSLRAIDEFEYIFILWKPGVTRVDRARLTPEEWNNWGSRAVWSFPSVRANDDHEAKFPIELPHRVIRLFSDPGDIVLDPFAGSGTSLESALRLNRSAIGFELHPPYVQLCREALARGISSKRQLRLA